ncbi:MAG TPA: methyltransferase domain-containing protein, partial [Tepidisphaeraceae bacterium]|nr:methyltransferase domain-containing protein [Tepidisphaeraceae bacterium]
IVADPTIQWETIEIIKSDQVTYVATNDYSFPIEDDRFDIVVSANVIEHVRKIWLWMRELARVTRPGGYVVTVNPVNWAFHENPVDCWRIWPDGMRALHDEAGLTTALALYDHLDDEPMNKPAPFPLLKQALRGMLGRKFWLPWYTEPPLDTISIGQKTEEHPMMR